MTGGESMVNFGSLETWTRVLALVAGGIRRRRVSIAVFGAGFIAVGCAAAVLLPRTYSTQASLLIKRNYVMPALANPRRAVPTGAETPTQSAAESVLSHESRHNMVRQNGLLARWDEQRPALLKLKDRAMRLVTNPIPDDEKEDVLAELLAKRITVDVEGEVVTVKATWTDRVTARDLVSSAMNAFLDMRRKLEVQAIADTYTILKRSADEERARVDGQLVAIAQVQQAAGTRAARPAPAVAGAGAGAPDDDGLSDLRGRILAARLAAAELAKAHAAKLADLEGTLAERRALQTERHPDVVAMTLALGRLRKEPAELLAARAEEARLLADYTARGGSLERLAQAGRPADLAEAATSAVRPEAAPAPVVIREKPEEDDATVYARTLFKGSLETYQDLLERLRDVEIELATAEVSFNYRYTITTPARLPKKADSPNVPVILIGAALAGVLAGVVRAVFRELQTRSLLTPSAFMAHLAAPATEPAAS